MWSASSSGGNAAAVRKDGSSDAHSQVRKGRIFPFDTNIGMTFPLLRAEYTWWEGIGRVLTDWFQTTLYN